MTEIKREDRYHELMRRTMFNYWQIKKQARREGPFEVVQLVNSFMGAMAHPWQELARDKQLDLKSISLNEARQNGWPVFTKECRSDLTPRSYFQMLTWTRHAFAHGNIEFFTDTSRDEIVEIAFHNELNEQRVWGSRVEIQILEDFLVFFQNLASERLQQRDGTQ